MKKARLILALAALLIVVGGGVFYLLQDTPPSYLTRRVGRMDIAQSIEAVGKVYARSQVDVGAQVSGQIIKLNARLGEDLTQGALIAQIDADKQKNELDITKAKLASARANLKSKEVALEIAKKQYSREEQLYKKKASSLENVESAKNNFYALTASVEELRAGVVQLEISLKNAQKDLAYTTITAPISGTVIHLAVDEGQTVNANQNAPTIVRLAQLDEMEVRMEIAEADVGKIHLGTPVSFSLLSDPAKKYEAAIASIDPADTQVSDSTTSTSSSGSSSSSSNNAIYYYAKFYVDNASRFLHIGMSVQNELIIAQAKDVIAVPNYAIRQDARGYFVQILENKKPVKKYVKLGIKDSLNSQITEGLAGGEELILSSSNDPGAARMRVRF